MKRKSFAKLPRSKPTTPRCTLQLNSTPRTCSTISVTLFTPRRVWFNLSDPLAQLGFLSRPSQYVQSLPACDSHPTSQDNCTLDCYENNSENGSYPEPSSAPSTSDLQPVPERLHQMSLRTHRRWPFFLFFFSFLPALLYFPYSFHFTTCSLDIPSLALFSCWNSSLFFFLNIYISYHDRTDLYAQTVSRFPLLSRIHLRNVSRFIIWKKGLDTRLG